ncbi:hypothetical protein CDO73_01340 [Saccharibacillus sp. O23]|uniref:3-hydroxyacyl-ACP dehydratase FabZ family protein n=1 Tax=Saccharibacillus sp. O23 TaxID=2009338 RepID=UPI000B4E414F|nr:hypothetical protein [Saccharibacillus sp. O23]OWR33177.1 hypothetical protein CDO73_01340 [Saccharibacillus sp. O23]
MTDLTETPSTPPAAHAPFADRAQAFERAEPAGESSEPSRLSEPSQPSASEPPESAASFDVSRIRIDQVLPHRPPFLFLDGILELRPGEYALGFKTIAPGDVQPSARGEAGTFPSTLLIEALAQLAGVMYAYRPDEDTRGRIGYLAGLKKLRVYRAPSVGERIVLRAECRFRWQNIVEAQVSAYSGEERLLEGVLIVTSRE